MKHISNAIKPVSPSGREDIIQNYCVTFSHNFNHKYSRFKNMFVMKGAPVTKENALKIAGILFPDYTDIQIESIDNDELTLAPSEYQFMQGMLRDKLYVNLRATTPYIETDYDKYLLKLIHKMEARTDQFPVYHT